MVATGVRTRVSHPLQLRRVASPIPRAPGLLVLVVGLEAEQAAVVVVVVLPAGVGVVTAEMPG